MHVLLLIYNEANAHSKLIATTKDRERSRAQRGVFTYMVMPKCPRMCAQATAPGVVVRANVHVLNLSLTSQRHRRRQQKAERRLVRSTRPVEHPGARWAGSGARPSAFWRMLAGAGRRASYALHGGGGSGG